MVLECLTWIPQYFRCSLSRCEKRKAKLSSLKLLPDDILIDILSRLPADSVLQCQKVCKHWRVLITSTYYVALQHKRAPTVILVQCHHDPTPRHTEKLHFYELDKNAKKLNKKRLKFEQTLKEYNAKLVGSTEGLLHFWTRIDDSIGLNLITNRVNLFHGYLCGVYFHPLASEYRCVWFDCRAGYEYYTCTFTIRNVRKIARNSLFNCFRPAYETSPATVNLALHWIVAPCLDEIKGVNPCMHAVMVFRIEHEDMFTLPHPGTTDCTSSLDHAMMHLFVHDEHLCLGHVHVLHGEIDIWVLEDYANWKWVKTSNIVFHGSAKNVPMRYFSNLNYHARVAFVRNKYYFTDIDFYCNKVKILSVQKDEVLIDWFSSGLYMVDLNRGIITGKIDVPSSDLTSYSCVAYTSSVANLHV